ncbi:MAG: hypothetical protein KBD78_13530 [Oligoflexales bacterium]|nr:hypothetical protein [Oligoflexales bacterium]
MAENRKPVSTFGTEFSEIEVMALIIQENKVLKKKVLDKLYDAKGRHFGPGASGKLQETPKGAAVKK